MIKGVHFVRKATAGKPIRWYVYAWRGGPLIHKHVGPKRPTLSRDQLQELLDAIPRNDEGTLAALIVQWRGLGENNPPSPEWKNLAEGTKDLWGFEVDRINERWGKSAIAVWSDPRMIARVVEWRDTRADTARGADQGVTVLTELLKFGMIRGLIRINVAEHVPAIYKGADRAEIIWTDADIAAYHASADEFFKLPAAAECAKDILDLATTTGMRRADLAGVTLAEVGEHAIVRTAKKKSRGRRRRAVIPLTPKSRAVIERLRGRFRAPGVETLLVNSKGLPWAPASVTMTFNGVRDAANGGAGIVHAGNPELGEVDRKKHLHDCRGTFVTHLCLADLTNEEIGRVVAWSPENVDRVRRIYVDDAAVVVALAERITRASVN